MSSGSTRKPVGLSRRYSASLRAQLGARPGASLRPARLLGREALAAGLDTLDLLRIHERALAALPRPRPAPLDGNDGRILRAASFLAEALSPIGNAHRSAGKESLELLKREIKDREAAQRALERSVRHHAQLLEKSKRMQDHLRRLSHQILSAQEEERKRISRELHDEIGQTLTAINVQLATLKKEATADTAGLKRRIGRTQRLLERSMNTVHRFARELRPSLLDDLGLVAALHAHIEAFTAKTRIPVDFTTFAAVEKLDSAKRIVLYRVAQEAFTNIAKHAQASAVRASITRHGDAVQMEIQDNGRSFQVDRVLAAKRFTRLGLLGMRERVEMIGGVFSVASAPGEGTRIRARIPLRESGE